MAISRADRRRDREPRVIKVFGPERASAALDLLEVLEFAWHDCYAEITPPDQVIEDVILVSGGDLAELIHAARLAVHDWRDLRVTADHQRRQRAD